MRILGIESSCDETAAAVVEDGQRLLCNVVQSQIDIHSAFGGVVPEVASRSHLEVVLPVVEEALTRAESTWDDIDAIAVTYAPGLIGSLLIGVLTARTLAYLKQKPLYAVHHVEGHVYANFLTEVTEGSLTLPALQPKFPLLALIVSGGHSQLALFEGHGDYRLLGQTQDDAVGEAFDKVAKIIGLPYPGGPSVSKAALEGDPYAYEFPKAKFTCTHSGAHLGMASKAAASNGQSGTPPYHEGAVQPTTQLEAREVCHYYDFSFSGLKTAVLRRVQAECGVGYDFPSRLLAERLDDAARNNIAASFQRVAIETLVDKTVKAFHNYSPASVVIAGGVAANRELRRQLTERLPIAIEYADPSLCTDNAAMIATLAYYMAQSVEPSDPLSLEVVPSLSMTKTAWAQNQD